MASINNKTAGAGFFGGGGGGSPAPAASQSPFVPAGFANVSTFNTWYELAISPDGKKIYVSGLLTSSGNGAIAQVDVATGLVTATVDLGATTEPQGLAVSPDNLSVYANDANNPTWWKIATTGMSISHTATLASGAASTSHQQFDLSPDGSKYVWVNELDAKLYMINTSTFAQTNQTMSHTAGNLTAVCFYNGSNSNVYVAHAGSGVVDLYAIGGAYTSSVSTGAGGTPAFNAMRSGINGTFLIADSGDNKSLIYVNSGTPHIALVKSTPKAIVANTLSPTATADSIDIYYACINFNGILQAPGNAALSALLMPSSVVENGESGIALLPGSSELVFTLSGVNYPEVWTVAAQSALNLQDVGAAGNIPTSDGKGNLFSVAPFSTTGWTGSGTLSGGGTVTITTAVATTSSIICVSPTGTANVLPPAVTTKSAGSFVVTGTATGTFDWTILKP